MSSWSIQCSVSGVRLASCLIPYRERTEQSSQEQKPRDDAEAKKLQQAERKRLREQQRRQREAVSWDLPFAGLVLMLIHTNLWRLQVANRPLFFL